MLLNNLSESFNKFILKPKDKPIISLMENIRTRIMRLIVKGNVKAQKWSGPICLKIEKKLVKIVI